MALGLGFAMPVTPEVRRAQVLAQLNGSTALPNGAGATMPPVGQSAPAGPPQQPPAQQAPQAAPQLSPEQLAALSLSQGAAQTQPQQPAERDIAAEAKAAAEKAAPGTPKWARIVGAIGHVLLSADAGYHGRGMPSSPAKAWKAEDNQQEQVQEFLINSVARAYEASRKAPAAERMAILKQYEAAVKQLAPDFDLLGLIDSLQTDSERLDKLAPAIAAMSPEAKAMFMSQLQSRGGDAQAADELLKDQRFMDGLLAFEDERNAGTMKLKADQIKAAAMKLGIRPETLAEMTPEEFAQAQGALPEKFRLSPSELQSIKRNPAYARMFGLKAPDMEQKQTLDSRAGAPQPAQQQNPEAAEEVGPAPSPAAPTARPSAARPSSPPPTARSQAKSNRQPYMPKGDGPVYTRPGYNEELADPATQRELSKVADQRGLDRDVVEEAITQTGRKQPAQAKAPPKGKEPPSGKVQKFKVPKGGRTIPGVGKMKEGETVIYDPATGKYRRG